MYGVATVYIGLGSNLGDRVCNCVAAVRELSSVCRIEALSSLYETDPVGVKGEQPPYVNAVLKVASGLDPYALLEALQSIERRLGRLRSEERWAPRTIDLDLLLYDTLVVDSPSLTLPHPRMHARRFVLVPLCEIEPTLIHPVLSRPVRDMLDGLRDDHAVRLLGPFPL